MQTIQYNYLPSYIPISKHLDTNDQSKKACALIIGRRQHFVHIISACQLSNPFSSFFFPLLKSCESLQHDPSLDFSYGLLHRVGTYMQWCVSSSSYVLLHLLHNYVYYVMYGIEFLLYSSRSRKKGLL